MFPQLLPKRRRNLQIKIILLLEVSFGVAALFPSIECPVDIEPEISSRGEAWSPLQKHCALHFACSNVDLNPEQLLYPYHQTYEEEFFGFGCDAKENPEQAIKFKVTVIENSPANEGQISCPSTRSPEDRLLFPHPGNCSLFYKCDWSTAVLFECPEELHFNNDLQICDWPWQASCDENWTRCPRPRPLCPAQHSLPVYLPHPYLCDQFYQCSWGQAHLQNCPTGLHFNPKLKVCDWPHNAKCHIC